MEIKIYNYLPNEAMMIRSRVFVEEQGFTDYPDEIDERAMHILLWDGEDAVASSRLVRLEDGSYLVGRIAVLRERRGGGLGRSVVSAAEALAKENGGERMVVHAQAHARGFYSSLGYSQFGEEDTVEGCAHLWMEKQL
jgi:predicted GNAT family N-acyltransferase